MKAGICPGGTKRNKQHVEGKVAWDQRISEEAKLVLCDVQTSGGLLIAVPRAKSAELRKRLEAAGTPAAARIGEIVPDPSGRIQVDP